MYQPALSNQNARIPLFWPACVWCAWLWWALATSADTFYAMPPTFSFNDDDDIGDDDDGDVVVVDDDDDELSLLATSVATFYTLHPPPRLRMKSPARQRPSLLVSNWISRQFLAHFIPTNDQTTNKIFSMVSSCIICTACHINGLPVLRHMRHVVIWYLWHNNEKMTVQWWATY